MDWPTVRLRTGLEAASEPAFKLTVSALLITAALGATYLSSEDNFPGIELRDVLARGMAISLVLLLGSLALSLRSKTLANVAMALVTMASVFTAYIVHTDLFYPGNRIWMIVVCLASLVSLIVAYRLIDQLRWGGLTLSMVASIPVVALIWSRLWPMFTAGIATPGGLLHLESPVMWVGLLGICAGSVLAPYLMHRFVDASLWGAVAFLSLAAFLVFALTWLNGNHGESGSGHYADGWQDHPKVQAVTFQETPNVYFVGFDSITPEAIMRKHMGIETSDFHRVMEEEMRRFPNLFSNSVPTTSFYRVLMALDLGLFLDHREVTGSSPDYFAGHDLSPLVWIMKENGYETTSIYNDTFFGYRPGQGIDRYIINKKRTVCSLLDDDIRPWAFWGFCWNRKGGEFLDAPVNGEEAVLTKGDFLVRELTTIDSTRPQFVIAYLYMPGHSPKSFNYDDKDDRIAYLERFEENFNRAAVYLKQIIEHLKINDPSAILFVYGDHGAWLSRGIAIEEDPTFFLQDRFGILGGVYPPDRCAAEFDEAGEQGLRDIPGHRTCDNRMSVWRAEPAPRAEERPVLGVGGARRPLLRV